MGDSTVLVVVLGVPMVIGLALAFRWSGVTYRPWVSTSPSPARAAGIGYLSAVLCAFTGAFWAGLLVTGPAIRLAMRLLAVTAGDRAQRRRTEADEIVGEISAGGTFFLVVFGGVMIAVLSGTLYLLLRRWLPAGRWAGPTYGMAHLVILGTRFDPLRPDNPDFDLVGPGWLSVATFALISIAHGVAVVAFVNRASAAYPDALSTRRPRRALVALVPPALFLVPVAIAASPVALGLLVAMGLGRYGVGPAFLERPAIVFGGRILAVGIGLALLPGTVSGLADIVDR